MENKITDAIAYRVTIEQLLMLTRIEHLLTHLSGQHQEVQDKTKSAESRAANNLESVIDHLESCINKE